METKKSLEAAAIEAYRANSKRRRAQRKAENELGVTAAYPGSSAAEKGGVLALQKPNNAKSVSSLGGATKVFGASRFSIPEFGRYAKRSTR
ncbi:hypothetical protein [Massilia sp. Mn16-1_5]|uniref:hypothetical protein n=1 Tax=Massilia sp. Mn16-1_5 TaxID=2079199 RepID=UPI00109EA9D3|nr:hypothetical protein [Massilia sp. Mn16-1_5]